ncbi:3'-5' exonuclease [Selenomonas ruminantium]|uniref:DNA 3'-5' helicase n=1 Tax=Selenomonas ruminantium TaxID=971 RepID=A0A1K1PSF6_SELRU|nr:3'-5' exonuclease [Selenomonas ruminantium]SFW50397.1 DNA helicase-2 / ATP-dependent DNA helicase PcrA [Selenomonas ruminantium]
MAEIELNKEQRQAVEELEANILLLAPAGTGKTNTLACRIAHIIAENRALPEEILCLTFTNKACREMRERVEARAGDSGSRVMVKTFHGFCYEVIKTEAKRHSDLFTDFTIFDETDCQGLLKEIVAEEWPLRAVQNLVNQLKEKKAEFAVNSGDLVKDYEDTLKRLLKEDGQSVKALALDDSYQFHQRLFEGWQQWGPQTAALYDERLHELHGLDFADLLVQVDELFRQDSVASKWARRFVYINIDEVQDTSLLEYRIISQIFGASHLLLCGDYFQTIYEWRGSHPELVLRKYQQDYNPRRIVLHENYRATQVLLNASFDWLRNSFPERVNLLYPDGLQAVSPDHGEPIVLKGAMDFAEEAQWIYYAIQQLPVSDYSRVCILTRSNRYNKDLSAQFRSLGRLLPENERLPFMLIDEQKFFRRQEIKDALAVLKLAVNKHDVSSLVRVLNRYAKGIGPATIKKLSSEEIRGAGIRLTDFVDEDARRSGDPYAGLLAALEAENVVVFDVESTGVDTTRDEIIQIAGIRLDKNGGVKEKFVRLIKPLSKVGDSVHVHGLSDEFLADNGGDPRKVLQEFCAFAHGAVLVGHNVTYDLRILGSELSRLEMPPLEYPQFYDTLDIFRRFYPNLPNHKLEFLGKYCQVSHPSSHDALDDILATAEILLYAVERDLRPKVEARREIMEKYQELFSEWEEKLTVIRREARRLRPWQLLGQIVLDCGMKDYYEAHKEPQRVEHLRDLFRQAKELDDEAIRPLDAIERFLRYTTLSNTELDTLTRRQQIPIITVHQAKGSEFDYVFLAGLQEGTFPGFQAEKSGRLAEESRLFYVAMTRAKKRLFLSWSQTLYGRYRHMSGLVKNIPRKYLQNG